jgi:hypothetical protein
MALQDSEILRKKTTPRSTTLNTLVAYVIKLFGVRRNVNAIVNYVMQYNLFTLCELFTRNCEFLISVGMLYMLNVYLNNLFILDTRLRPFQPFVSAGNGIWSRWFAFTLKRCPND